MEDKWPPVEECPQHGLIYPFLEVFEWESRDHVDDSEFEDLDDQEDGYVVKNGFQLSKRFLQQVRNTRGYGVDCIPPGAPFDCCFMSLDVKDEDTELHDLARFVVGEISKKTQKTYKLCSIEKFVLTANLTYLLTIKAKEDVPDADAQTFYAMVYAPPCDEYKLKELLIKPNYDAPTV